MAHRRFADDLLARGPARRPGPGREDDPRHDALGHGLVVVEPLLEGRADQARHLPGDLRVVEPVLGLALELRLGHVDAQDGDDPLADVVRRDGHTLRRELVLAHVIADRPGQRLLDTVFVGAAGARGDAVRVGLEDAVRGLGPAQRHLHADRIVPLDQEGLGMDRRLAALVEELVEELRDALRVMELLPVTARLVAEDDLEPLVEVALRFEGLEDALRIELRPRAEDLRVGTEVYRRADPAPGALRLLELGARLAP